MCRLISYVRKIIAFAAVCIAGLLACLSLFANVGARVCFADTSGGEEQTRIVGYLPTWSYKGYTIDYSALTHINIAFCNLNSRGEISCDIPDGDMRAIVENAHASGVKVMAALGGGGYGEPYRDLIKSEADIQSLNTKIVAFCEKYNLDGIDLDIELDSGDSIWNNYGAWVSALRNVCDERNWLLSTATAQWVAYNVTEQTFSLFDFINVMAYDNDSRNESSHSSYQFAVECLDYFHKVKNIPKQKLVLGVPFYGRGYNANGDLDWESYMSFSDLVAINAGNFNADRYNDVAYTGAQTMREKCELSKEYGGIMIWELTLDAEGEYSLLAVIKEELFPSAPLVPDGNGKEENDGKFVNSTAFKIIIGISVPLVVAAVTAAISVIVLKKAKSKKLRRND